MRPRGSKIRWLMAATAMMLAQVATAAEHAPQTSVPQPDEVLRRMSSYLAAQKNVTFHAEITFDSADPAGRKLQFAGALDVALRRPDRLYVDYADDLSSKELWYDGERLVLFDRDHDVQASVAVKPDVDTALALLDRRYMVSLPLADLVLGDPYGELSRGVKSGAWIGRHDVAGVDCDHLAFEDENIDWQIWVEPGERPLPRKLVITYKKVAGAPEYAAVLSDWNFAAKLPDSRFVAQIPAGAMTAQFLAVQETR